MSHHPLSPIAIADGILLQQLIAQHMQLWLGPLDRPHAPQDCHTKYGLLWSFTLISTTTVE